MTYSDIFGEEITYTVKSKVDRPSLVDKLLGEKYVEESKVGRGPGMRAQALQAYIELMNEHNERKDRQRKKGKMRQKMKKNKLGMG